MPINRNRGAHIRRHSSGITVAMYIDAPGQFVDGNGYPVSEDLAREAGFDVDALLAEGRKLAKKREIERALDTSGEDALVRTGLKVEEGSAPGLYRIVDIAGRSVSKDELSKEAAETTYRALTGQDITLAGTPADPDPVDDGAPIDDEPAEAAAPPPKAARRRKNAEALLG